MSDDERRSGARFITELGVVLRSTKTGAPLDDRATAHDVSVKGFKVETQASLAENTFVYFVLELPMGSSAAGKGRVKWCNRETFATWAGIETVSMSWSDKRRLSQMLHPDSVDWANLTSLCFKLVLALTIVVTAHRVVMNAPLRGLVAKLAPKLIALFVMGWALSGMFQKDKPR